MGEDHPLKGRTVEEVTEAKGEAHVRFDGGVCLTFHKLGAEIHGVGEDGE